MKTITSVALALSVCAGAAAQNVHANPRAEARHALHFDTSRPLRDITPELPAFKAPHEAPLAAASGSPS